MKVFSGKRGSGKSTAAIRESAETNKYILVGSKEQAKYIFNKAQRLGLNIPFPITLNEVVEYRNLPIKEVIVDEAGVILEYLLRKKITMLTITEEED